MMSLLLSLVSASAIIAGTPPASTDVEGSVYSPEITNYQEVLDDNPQTSLPWDTADLATLEVGVKSTT